MEISEEAMRVALIGLQKLRAEIDTHIQTVESNLNPPLKRRYRKHNDTGVAEAIAVSTLSPEVTRMPAEPKGGPVDYKWVRNGRSYHRVWLNDPEEKYMHNRDTGEIIIKRDGQPRARIKPSAANLKALARAREKAWAVRRKLSKSAPVNKTKTRINGHATA